MARKIITLDGCGVCETLKERGLCKKEKCVEINSKEGQKLAREAKVRTVPQCVTVTKNQKAKKCDTMKVIKKFLK